MNRNKCIFADASGANKILGQNSANKKGIYTLFNRTTMTKNCSSACEH